MVYIPTEIMTRVFSFHNPYLGLEKKMDEIYDDLKKKNLVLTYGGIFTKSTTRYFDNDPRTSLITKNDYENISKCIDEIQSIFTPQKTVKIGSYSGKHRIESYRRKHNQYSDCYISNGVFIMAMLLSGIKMKKDRVDENPNCEFYVGLKNKLDI